MEEGKHTPGPWFSTEVMQHVTGFIISSKESESICRIAKHDGKSKLPSRENAHLIAAAPELLQSVNSLAEFIQFYSGKNIEGQTKIEHDFELGAVLNQARAAIAKATGVK